MPTQIFETKQHRTLLAKVEKHFASNGWVVEPSPSHERIDLRVTKGYLRSSLRCIDGTDLRFRSVAATLSMMENDVRTVFSQESRHIIWVSTENPFPLSLERLIEKDIIILLLEELCLLEEIVDFDKSIVDRLDVRKTAILKTSHRACVQIALWLSEMERADLAIVWFRNAAASIPGFSTARRQLFNLLVQQGQKAEAYAVGKEIFSLKPDVENLVSSMEKLATELTLTDDAIRWKALASSERNVDHAPKTFDALLKKISRKGSL
jgi:tetratricopeptide (TPR) repeat protein